MHSMGSTSKTRAHKVPQNIEKELRMANDEDLCAFIPNKIMRISGGMFVESLKCYLKGSVPVEESLTQAQVRFGLVLPVLEQAFQNGEQNRPRK